MRIDCEEDDMATVCVDKYKREVGENVLVQKLKGRVSNCCDCVKSLLML